eukprot:5614917-Pyramimonas_sp.AAC.1
MGRLLGKIDGLKVIQWNIGKLSFAEFPEVLYDLRRWYGSPTVVICLQEVSNWPEDPELQGWEIRHAYESHVAL